MTKNKSLKNLRKWILFALGIIILFVSFKLSQSIANSNDTPPPARKNLVKEVYVLEVTNGSFQVQIPSNGVLEAHRRISLTSRVQGVMQTIKPLFKTGQKYKIGQTLVQIDASDYSANVKAQRASLYNKITSVLPDLQLDFNEGFDQWSQFLKSFDIEKPIPRLPIMKENVRLFVSGRGIISSYYALQNLEQNLQYYSIKAPFDGVLVSANMTEGSLVRPGQQLGEFIAPGQYELKVSLPKSYIQKIDQGAKVLLNSIDTNQTFTGTVERINAKVNTQTQSVEVFIRVSNQELKEGMFLEANINANTFDNVFAINRGLLNGDQQLYVVVDNKLELKKVVPLHFTETLAIVSGLENLDEIVAQPLIGAFVGMEVLPSVITPSK
jgi:multidrug efflux pump subunit AcrA (membrane-fusion protein)